MLFEDGFEFFQALCFFKCSYTPFASTVIAQAFKTERQLRDANLAAILVSSSSSARELYFVRIIKCQSDGFVD